MCVEKYLSGLTFVQAVSLLVNGTYKEMRQHEGDINGQNFIGNFYYLNTDDDLVYKKNNVEIIFNPTTEQILGTWWVGISKPQPEVFGFFKSALAGYYKPITIDIWVNVFYNYKTHKTEEYIYNDEGCAKRGAISTNDSWVFIKTCHSVQQLSIPWKEVSQ